MVRHHCSCKSNIYICLLHRLPKHQPPQTPPSLEDAKVCQQFVADKLALTQFRTQLTPLASSSLISQLTYSWITDIMVLGYQRTLQASDLHKLDSSREVKSLSEQLEAAWARRVEAAAKWNAKFDRGEVSPSILKRMTWVVRAIPSEKDQTQKRSYSERRLALERHWREVEGRKEASLAWALNDVFGWSFWLGGVFKVCTLGVWENISGNPGASAIRYLGTRPS